jgi:putative DNA-invertase from lambdoid prophage Rac
MQANKRTGAAMAVYSYARVSTARQASAGESLDVQLRVMGGYATMQGLTISQTFVERGVSGSTPLDERPQGRALLATLKPGDVVVTAKLDRMFRSALDALNVLADLKARDISLHMIDLGGDVTGNGISKLVFTILSAVAEAERDRIRERISTVKADQKARGRYLGGKLPYGYMLANGRLEPVAEQQEIIQHIRDLRARGQPLRAIQAAASAKLSLAAINRICREDVV